MKPKYKRLKTTILIFAVVSIGLWLILKNFNENIAFFYSPSELANKPVNNQTIRLGGLVLKGSILKLNATTTEFVLTDNKAHTRVRFKGLLPNLFRENQGIVARGRLEGALFIADEVLAKHDENYMPKGIKKALDD